MNPRLQAGLELQLEKQAQQEHDSSLSGVLGQYFKQAAPVQNEKTAGRVKGGLDNPHNAAHARGLNPSGQPETVYVNPTSAGREFKPLTGDYTADPNRPFTPSVPRFGPPIAGAPPGGARSVAPGDEPFWTGPQSPGLSPERRARLAAEDPPWGGPYPRSEATPPQEFPPMMTRAREFLLTPESKEPLARGPGPNPQRSNTPPPIKNPRGRFPDQETPPPSRSGKLWDKLKNFLSKSQVGRYPERSAQPSYIETPAITRGEIMHGEVDAPAPSRSFLGRVAPLIGGGSDQGDYGRFENIAEKARSMTGSPSRSDRRGRQTGGVYAK